MPDPQQFVSCPGCRVMTSPGAFCEHCGKSLDSFVEDEARGEEPRPDPIQENQVVPSNPDSVGIDETRRQRPTPPANSPVVAPQRGVASTGLDSGSVVRDDTLALEINELRVFITGIKSSFNVRLVPLGADAYEAHGFELVVKLPDQEPIKEHRLRFPRDDWNLAFRGDEPGMAIPGRVELSYQLHGQTHRYEGDFVWDCYPPDENPGNIIENLVVKADENRSEYAGSQNISIRVLENFTGHSAASLQQQMRQMKVPPLWKRIPLYRCFSSDVEQVLLEALPGLGRPDKPIDRLTLKSLRKRVHLLGGHDISLGRHRDMDILTRMYNAQGVATSEDNQGISKAHARIMIEPGKVWLCDGGFDPVDKKNRASALGTKLNGKTLSYNEPVELPIDTPFRIQLAHFVFNGHMYSCGALGGQYGCEGCVGTKKPSALILERADKRSDVYCIVFCMMAMRNLDSSFTREVVLRHADGFALTGPKGLTMKGEWLDTERSRCGLLPAGWTVGPYEPSDPISKKG